MTTIKYHLDIVQCYEKREQESFENDVSIMVGAA